MDLNATELDVLKELASIGANAAGTALSNLTNQTVSNISPKVELCEVENVKNEIKNPEEKVAAICVGVFEKNSSVLITFKKKYALLLVDMLMDKKLGTTEEFDDMSKSAFNEMGNIVVCAYVSAVANFLNTKIGVDMPLSTIDMVGSVVDAAIVQIAVESNKVLITDANFSINNEIIGAKIYFLFEPSTVRGLLDKASKL